MSLGLISRLLAVSAATVALTTPSTASAATWVHVDTTGDVRTTQAGQSHGTVDPTNRAADITRVQVAHGARNVVITVRTAAAVPTTFFDLEINVVTAHRSYAALRAREPGTTWPGSNYTGLLDDRFAAVRCTGFRLTIDRPTRTARAVVPRRCIGRPRWVRTEVALQEQNGSAGALHFDDGLQTGVTRHIATSPRVFAGRG